MAEGASNDSGTIMKWAEKIGFFDDPKYSSAMASSVPDTDGVYFIPAFSGLQVTQTFKRYFKFKKIVVPGSN